MKKIITISFLVLAVISSYAQSVTAEKDKKREAKITSILKQLTLEEKIQMCSGKYSGAVFSGVERLNIPDVNCTDGPRAVTRSNSSTVMPSGIAFGASWDPSLVKRANNVLGLETRAKGIGVLLAPGINIQRDPLNGRFFEYYTEDPYLNGEIAVAAVKGIQDAGVGACIKHYACNNRENNRNFYMSMVDDRTLNEIYLPAFKAAVTRADALTVMTSANGVNGEFVSDSKRMLTDILKNKWGFQGFVLTDWLQTRSTEKAALAGLDVSMPGGTDCGFGTPLLNAVKAGSVPVAVIDDKVRRILRVYDKLGYLDKAKKSNIPANLDIAQNQSVAKEAAEQSMVLLKNYNRVLPLVANKINRILVMGPNADKYLCYPGAGGSSGAKPPFEITVLKGITDFIGADKVTYLTSEDLGGFQVIPQNAIVNAEGSKGFKASYFVKDKDNAVLNRVDPTIDFMWEMKSPDAKIDPGAFRKAVYSAKIIPPMNGKYTIRMIVNGIANMYHGTLQGEHLAFADSRQTLNIVNTSVELKKNMPYDITVEYEKSPGDAAIRLEWELPEAPAEKLRKLDSLAKTADAVIYVAGIDHSSDTEGRDRNDINFPGAQENMLNHLSKLNKNLVAVMINGSPLQVGGWLPNVPAVLEAWYPGMEGGVAVANVLFGKINPSGKLPFSWPTLLADVPCKVLGTENNDAVYYTDSLMVGYRYYDTKHKQPEFPFGYGLSYTSFRFGKLTLTKIKGTIKGKITVTNTGKTDGSEVVQVYVKPLNPHVFRPIHELKAFRKTFIPAGKTKTVEFDLDREAFSYYDVKSKDWLTDHGSYVIQAGSSSRDVHSEEKINY